MATLCHIFYQNEDSKNAFRPSGFIWTISVLDGIGKCMQVASKPSSTTTIDPTLPDPEDNTPTSPTPAQKFEPSDWPNVFGFLKTLLYTLAVVLTNNTRNQVYFREEIDFNLLCEVLQSCREMMSGKEVKELCDSLLNMALKVSWPPSCSVHSSSTRLQLPWEVPVSQQNQSISLTSSTTTSFLSHSKGLADTCQNCRDSLYIDNPEIFKLIIQLLGASVKKETSDNQEIYYIYVLKTLSFLADALPFNQQKLSSIGTHFSPFFLP